MPALIFPKQLWTGKQLISNLIKIVVDFPMGNKKNQIKEGLNMEAKAKVS